MLPDKEQMLYAQLAVVQSLLDYIADLLQDTQFRDLDDSFAVALNKVEGIRKEMRAILNPRDKNVCY